MNGTTIVNASTIQYTNNSALVLSATPTNANYSYSNFDINGTSIIDNPYLYNLTTTTAGNYSATVSVNFTAEATPTPSPSPDPDALTIDDAGALGLAGFLFGVAALSVAMVFVMRKRS